MENNVILLFGGKSEERLVSVASAQNLAGQYDFSQLIYQDLQGGLHQISLGELMEHQDVFLKEFEPSAPAFADSLDQAISFFQGKTVFLGWHGAESENGEVQDFFEKNKIAFTGSDSLASKVAFEKNLAKEIISNAGMRLPMDFKFKSSQVIGLQSKFEQFLNQYKKVVFKPTNSGSSYGLHIVGNDEQLQVAIESIKKDSFKSYILENFIAGRELTVGVVQIENELIALPASEIILNKGSSFNYEGKYLGSGVEEVTPAHLSAEEVEAVQRLALDAHVALGCYGYSRTDMILAPDGPYFLETNTLPGLSKPSFIPQQLLAADIPFNFFIESQINLARCRYIVD